MASVPAYAEPQRTEGSCNLDVIGTILFSVLETQLPLAEGTVDSHEGPGRSDRGSELTRAPDLVLPLSGEPSGPLSLLLPQETQLLTSSHLGCLKNTDPFP